MKRRETLYVRLQILYLLPAEKAIPSKAFRWIEALRTELTSYEFDDVYENLKSCGCTKDRVTVRRWIYDEDAIIPQDKEI